ncbi:MAG: serine/threonine-protein kinase [Myxococcota bacterium]|nr:serine/threonine-protein kinase [Myxococcota bacterium]
MQERFGRYELQERIGVGGMAEVFRAVQRGAAGFARPVAIKRILPHIASDPETVQMFVEEAKLAVQLHHPNIAQIFDLGQAEGQYFIAMEYVDGQSLEAVWDRWAERGRRLPPEAVAHLLVHVCDALHHAHFAEDAEGRPLGIIHRDVSPSNVLLSFGGEVKVIDFGLAKAENRVSRTRDGIVKGKLAYLSPEQAHGRTFDRRSDLFSLGVCAWELLTGKRAFRRDDDRKTVLAIRAGKIDPPSRHAVLPEPLERIVTRLLAIDPDLRYRTALEAREDVEAWQRRAGVEFARRNLTALMRSTFPERFAEEPGARGAIELVRAKAKDARPAPPPAPHDTVDDEWGDVPTDVRGDAADTVPGIELPDGREG